MAKRLTLTTVVNHLDLSADQVDKLTEHYQESNTRYSRELVVYYHLLKMYVKGKITIKELFLSDVDRRNGVKFVHIYAKYNNLPSDFEYFTLARSSGATVAHIAAMYGMLPEDFDQWDIRNIYTETVAHIAARHGMLPDDFDQWDLCNNYHESVAYIAAIYNKIPDNFTQWQLATPIGWTVAHEYAYKGNYILLAKYAAKDDRVLDLKNIDGITVLDILIEKGTVQDLYSTIKQIAKNNKKN